MPLQVSESHVFFSPFFTVSSLKIYAHDNLVISELCQKIGESVPELSDLTCISNRI